MARTYCSINAFILACVAAASIVGASACENTARGLKQDAAEAEQRTRDDRARAAQAAREAGNDATAAVNRAARAAGQAGDALAERASALKETIEVKSALMADPSVDATRIDVDADPYSRTLTLSGDVPTYTERDMAGVIAKAHADGYKVVNAIQVRPRGSN